MKEERRREDLENLISRLFFGPWPPPSFKVGLMLLFSLGFLQG